MITYIFQRFLLYYNNYRCSYKDIKKRKYNITIIGEMGKERLVRIKLLKFTNVRSHFAGSLGFPHKILPFAEFFGVSL